jgi:hypothetical protein
MATKNEMRDEICRAEPDNVVATNKKASHAELKAELSKIHDRLNSVADRPAPVEPVSVALHFRIDGENVTWKYADADGNMSVLKVGESMPGIGHTVLLDDGRPATITSRSGGLPITAGDLVTIEVFDPRRVYETPNRTKVVFKRADRGRTVLWSYTAQGEIAIGGHVVLSRTDSTAKPTSQRKKRMSQKALAAWLIANDPTITGKELTAAIRDAFPSSNVSDRHGPHYLSLSRHGRLPEPTDDDPRTWEE